MKNKKIKVAYLDQSKIFSGAENSLKDLINYLDKDKFESNIIFQYPMEHHKRFKNINKQYLNDSCKWWMGSDRWEKPLRGTDFLKRIYLGFQLLRWAKSHQIDILHINLCEPKSFWWGFWLKFYNIKSILHVRSEEMSRLPNANTQRKYDCILTVSNYVKNRVLTKYKHPNIHAVYDAVDFIQNNNILSRNELFDKLKLSLNKKLISSVGMLQKIKNHEMAIKVFTQLSKKYPDYILLIAGGGLPVELERLKKIVKELKLEEKIIFTKKQIDYIDSVYKHSEFIFSLTLPGEAFGRVPFEALKFNTPTIVPKRGAANELFIDRKTGFMANPENMEEITEIANFIIESKNKTNQILKRSYEKFSILLSPINYSKNMSEKYNELSKIK